MMRMTFIELRSLTSYVWQLSVICGGAKQQDDALFHPFVMVWLLNLSHEPTAWSFGWFYSWF